MQPPKHKSVILTATLTSILLAGCATIVGKTEQLVAINSTPDQAQIAITDERGQSIFKGATPTTVLLKKGDGYFHGKDYTMTLSKEGYATQTITITSSANAWYIGGNILFGGLIGWFIVDPLTGAMWTLSPEQVAATLNEGSTTSPTSKNILQPDQVHIVLLEDVPPALRDKMVKITP